MKLGFIGTGNISSDVVHGICNSTISFKKIILSPRNKNKALKLKKKFKKVVVAKSNQEVIDKSDWIFLGVLPQIGEKILPKLKYKNNQVIEGNPDTIKTVNDVWKFSKNMWSQDPTWFLVETSNK